MPSTPYPTDPAERRATVERFIEEAVADQADADILALFVPHADRVEGGLAAARAFASVTGDAFRTIILVAPNMTERFDRIHVCRRNVYPGPCGDLPVDLHGCDELCDEDDDIFSDGRGHHQADGIDVQLPFLQAALEGFSVVPVIMGLENPEFCRELGNALGEVRYNRRTLIVACVDILEADEEGLSELRQLLESDDIDGLMRFLNAERVVLRGRGPLISALIAGRSRHAATVRILEMSPPSGTDPGLLSGYVARS